MTARNNEEGASRINRTIKVVLFLTILTAIVFWPVWKVIQFFQPNSRMYFKGCITASAILNGSDAKYVNLEIGRAGYEYAGNPKFELKFRDGTILIFPKVELRDLYRISNRDIEATEFVDNYPLSKEYNLDGCSVVIAEGRVIQVNVFGFDDSDRVQIRTDRTKEWRSIRFSDDDLVDLFGEPDRITDDLQL